MTIPKTGPNVIRAKLAPEQPVLLCLTLRDTFGSPITGMKLTATQAGKELRGPGGGALVTSDKGRVDIVDVRAPGALELSLDPNFVPVDAEDRRPNTKYQYNIANVTEIVEYQVVDDPANASPIDSKRAFATAFATVNPFDPVFRFPWQNPLHHEKLAGKDRIYANRLVNLSSALQVLFKVDPAAANALDHKGLITRLVDLFEQSKATAAAEAAALQATSSETDQGTAHEPETTPPSTPTPLPAEPTPEDPLKSTHKIEVKDETPKPEQAASPPPTPPAAAPSATTDSASLPRWVWYLLFHHSGLRYTPKAVTSPFGAHGTYIYPGLILQKMRERELDDQLGDSAPAPDAADITEAVALAERSKKNDAAKASILTSDPKKQKAGISKLFLAIADAEQQRLRAFHGPADILTGDHFALGLLKAKRLKKHTILTDAVWDVVTSSTSLRNDIQKDDWERLPVGFSLSPVFLTKKDEEEKKKGLGLDVTAWRLRRQETLDTILSAAVCDQTSESAELVRGHTLSGGIPANARQCTSLQYFTFANAKLLRRGMHLFYTGFGAAGADQDYPTTLLPWEGAAVFVDRLPDKTTKRVATPFATIAVVKIEDIVDANHPINKAIALQNKAITDNALANKRKPSQLTPLSIIDPAKRFDGVRRMDAESLGNGSRGDAFVKCVDDPNPKVNAVRLHVMKWTHQEIIVDIVTQPRSVLIRLFSTAAGSFGTDGTGIRSYTLRSDDTVDAKMNIVFGFIGETAAERVALMDACYLNPALLRR